MVCSLLGVRVVAWLYLPRHIPGLPITVVENLVDVHVEARGVTVIVLGDDMTSRVQIVVEAVCILLRANALQEGINPLILLPSMDR